jgi:hypothetical protein
VILDGTNNHCERAIGWWIKERYRSMHGYKQTQSALGVSRLIAFAGNHLARNLCLADLMALPLNNTRTTHQPCLFISWLLGLTALPLNDRI